MTMGRPREFDTEQALEAAMKYFWIHGYESTSLHDLLKVMHLSKSSFYQTFSSKHELFQRCISHYQDSLKDSMMSNLNQSDSARKFIEGTFYSVADEAGKPGGKQGCLLMNTASEFAQRDPVIAGLVSVGTEKLNKVFLSAVKRAQSEGEIPQDNDSRALADYLISSMSGLKTMVKAGMSRKTTRNIVEVTLKVLD